MYPYSVCDAAGVSTPDEFLYSETMARILIEMAERTRSETRFSASFEVMETLLDCLERAVPAPEKTRSFQDALLCARVSCAKIRERFESQFRLMLNHGPSMSAGLPPSARTRLFGKLASRIS